MKWIDDKPHIQRVMAKWWEFRRVWTENMG